MIMETIQAYVTLIKDILTGFAALVATYVGFTGLQTWKRQLTANAEHELASRVLVAAYKVRDTINNCRLFAMEEDNSTVDVTKRIHDIQYDKLDKAQASLDVELLEAEAVWGNETDYRYGIFRLQALVQTLKAAYSRYYSYYSFSDDDSPKPRKEAYSILFTKGAYPKDDFSIRLDQAVQEAENFCDPN
jgi:hypothetical protein